MMVPKSYFHAKAMSPICSTFDGKAPVHVVSSKPCTSEGSHKKTDGPKKAGRLPSGLTASPSTTSKPVVIPSRTARGGNGKRKGYSTHPRWDSTQDIAHDASLVSPSASALLAMTAIPIPTARRMQSSQQQFVPNIHGAIQQAIEDDGPRRALSSSSPETWDFLLSAPDTIEIEGETDSYENDTTIAPSLSVRSLSTESMPSLEEDGQSISSYNGPFTPSLDSRRRHTRKDFSSSKGQDAIHDHPLLDPLERSDIINICSASTKHERQPMKAQTRSSFKSNLTASFHAIRSAARSMSAMNSPAPQEDLLGKSILTLSLPYSVERRPSLCEDPPEAALRRYLNPIFLSPIELHLHRGSEQSTVKSSIQLQTYRRGIRHSKYASRPPIFVPNTSGPSEIGEQQESRISDRETPLLTNSLTLRHREPRENSDFLRIVVLEMNMRKVGKLEGSEGGRAKLWLPARRENQKDAKETMQGPLEDSRVSLEAEKKAPCRWTSI